MNNLKKLDEELLSFERLIEAVLPQETAPSKTNTPQELKNTLGVITPNTDLEIYPMEKLRMLHTMLHLFYSSGNCEKLSREDIVRLHKEVKGKLSNHKNFDRLDVQ
jgi:hypothetical protein